VFAGPAPDTKDAAALFWPWAERRTTATIAVHFIVMVSDAGASIRMPARRALYTSRSHQPMAATRPIFSPAKAVAPAKRPSSGVGKFFIIVSAEQDPHRTPISTATPC